MSTTSVFQMNLMLASDVALSCITFDARSVSRRWMTVTDRASLAR